MIEKLPGADLYESFAYDISVLKYFVGVRNGGGRERQPGTSKNVLQSHLVSIPCLIRSDMGLILLYIPPQDGYE